MKKLIAVIALASSMGVAYANEPVALNDVQMDNVSAGGTAFAFADAQVLGFNHSATTQTIADAKVLGLVVVPTQAGHLLIDTGYSTSSSYASGF